MHPLLFSFFFTIESVRNEGIEGAKSEFRGKDVTWTLHYNMDRLRKTFGRRTSTASEYEPLHVPEEATALEGSTLFDGQDEIPFSWTEYSIFAILGMAMLWAWCVLTLPKLSFMLQYESQLTSRAPQEHVPCRRSLLCFPLCR